MIAIAAGLASTAAADVIWDEAVDGNLSNDPNSPTLLTFGVGDNIVRGTTLGSSVIPSDGYDAFGFTIEAGWTLEAIVLNAYLPATGGTTGFNFSSGAPLPLGGTLIFGPGVGGAFVGSDFLADGGIAPLGANDYFMEIREFGGPLAEWELNFVVTPAPSAMALLGLGGLVANRRRR
jgi:hypothetical protein